MANVGFASPVSFAGDNKNIGSQLESFRQNLESYINSYLPSYNKDDADLYITGGVVAEATFTPSLTNHLVPKSYVDGEITTALGSYLPLAGGTLTGALSIIKGEAATTPGLRFSGNATTGLYQNTGDTNTIRFATGGSQILNLSGTGDSIFSVQSGTVESTRWVNSDGSFLVGGPTTGNPRIYPSGEYSFQGDPDTYLYRVTTDQLGLAAGGYLLAAVGGSSGTFAGWMKVPDGTVSLPGVMFGNDTDTGIYRVGTNDLGIAAGGVLQVRVRTDSFRVQQVYSDSGALGNPNVYVASDGRLRLTTSTINAGTLDSLDSTQFLRSDANDTYTGTTLAMSGNLSFSSSTYGVVNFWPTTDDLYDCGSAARRFDDVYATNGTIITSDPATKSNVRQGTPGLQLLRKVKPITFNRNNGVRDHTGFDADNVKAALDELGVDLGAFVDPSVNPKKLDSGEELIGPKGLRIDELVAVLWDAVKEIDDELARTVRQQGVGGGGATPPGQ